MRGIDEETLIAVRKPLAAEKLNTDVIDALISLKIRELNTWLPIDEFLKSGFEGECWIFTDYGAIERACHSARGFKGSNTSWSNSCITHVMPIHKPEPPKMSKSIDRLLIESDDCMFEYIADCLATFPVSTHECYHCGHPIKYPVIARQSDIDNFRELMKTAYRIMDKYGISAHLLADIKAELVINATKKRKQEPPR